MSAPAVRVVKRAKLAGHTFGESSYTLYEAAAPGQRAEAPYFLVWLHGQDLYRLSEDELRTLPTRLRRRTFCLVPQNPEETRDGRRFLWGLSYTKAQNRNGLGFIYGEFNTEYIEALCGLVRQLSGNARAERVVLCGYSTGGFGALQLGAHAPELFDAIVSVAGHGLGTLESEGSGYVAPQPESGRIFRKYVRQCAPSLAAVPTVIAVHAQRDTVSSYRDAAEIVKAIQVHGGSAEVVDVPDDQADSDLSGKKKSKQGHSYYYYSLVSESSEDLVYARLREALSAGRPAPGGGDPRGGAADSVGEAAADGRAGLVEEAQERLQTNRTPSTAASIARLKRAHGLGDEVELALRMLPPAKLQELAARTVRQRGQLSQAPDKSAYVLALVSELDPAVEALVRELQRLDGEAAAGEDGCAAAEAEAEAGTASGSELAGIVASAQARLRANRGRPEAAAVDRLKAECGLLEEVELALRMLRPEHLAEVLAAWSEIKRKVAEKGDGGKFLLSIIALLDPDAEALVRALLGYDQSDGGAPEEAAAPAAEGSQEQMAMLEGASPEDAAVVATARARLQAPKGPEDVAAVQSLTADCGFGDEVELALRMLSPAHLREILAGEAEVRQKAAQRQDGGKFMLWLISQLDPDVEALVRKLLELEGRVVGEQAQAGEEQSQLEAVAEAKARLQDNRSTASLAAIRSFRVSLELGDEVELAMRMLEPAKLWKLIARKLELRKELASSKDRNRHILKLVSTLDPSTEALVRRVLEVDEQGSGATGGDANARSRSPARGRPPGPTRQAAAAWRTR